MMFTPSDDPERLDWYEVPLMTCLLALAVACGAAVWVVFAFCRALGDHGAARDFRFETPGDVVSGFLRGTGGDGEVP